ncbi:MAG: sigma-54-dependent Fis family transcriptional regulator [Deltaproteobacteria bacterium]|nr:sigma-54-dependent Fis family transcriptional regulator [Deltaproteobacteria bacterium]
MSRILVVEDQVGMREMVAEALDDAGFECAAVDSAERAWSELERGDVDAVVTDLRLPGESGMAVLARVRQLDPKLPVIIITAHATVEGAVDAMRQGATDYLVKPFSLDELEVRLRRALGEFRAELETRRLRQELRGRYGRLVGSSGGLERVFRDVDKVAPTPIPVLILGESGTGKELLAREIHERSPRARGPFVAVNCAAIAKGLIESELFGHEKGAFTGAHRSRKGYIEMAEGGTLFLDEIGDLDNDTQVKLLRFLQEKEVTRVGGDRSRVVDVRVLAATNRDLKADVAAGRFRDDLYFRLSVVTLALPPLRDRRDDVPALIEHFVAKWNTELHCNTQPSPEFVRSALAYDWPGNVRELENAIERAIVLCSGDLLRPDDLPFEGGDAEGGEGSTSLVGEVEAFERQLVARALAEADGNTSRAAKALGVKRTTLQYKIRKYGLGDATDPEKSPPGDG